MHTGSGSTVYTTDSAEPSTQPQLPACWLTPAACCSSRRRSSGAFLKMAMPCSGSAAAGPLLGAMAGGGAHSRPGACQIPLASAASQRQTRRHRRHTEYRLGRLLLPLMLQEVHRRPRSSTPPHLQRRPRAGQTWMPERRQAALRPSAGLWLGTHRVACQGPGGSLRLGAA